MKGRRTAEDEARRLALSHFLLAFLLYLGLAFIAPRNLLQYEDWLPSGAHMAINTAISIISPLRRWPLFVPTLVALAYLDYRISVRLLCARNKLGIGLWSLGVPTGIGAIGLWFAWALTQWRVGTWRHHNPGADCGCLREMPYVAAAAVGALVASVALEAWLRKKRMAGRCYDHGPQ